MQRENAEREQLDNKMREWAESYAGNQSAEDRKVLGDSSSASEEVYDASLVGETVEEI